MQLDSAVINKAFQSPRPQFVTQARKYVDVSELKPRLRATVGQWSSEGWRFKPRPSRCVLEQDT